jgi:glyoxylase-like metal-dependent hydrolase (beta-lactamase superfamily II)
MKEQPTKFRAVSFSFRVVSRPRVSPLLGSLRRKAWLKLLSRNPPTAKITVQALRRNISVLLGPGGNIAVLTGSDGKLLVDAEVVTARSNVAAALAGINADPIKQLINTHWHFDHTGGNEWVHQAGASILAHENTRKRLSVDTRVEGWVYTFPAAPAGAIPTSVFQDERAVHFNGSTLALKYYGPAHTDSDISVHFTDADVLTPETRSGIATILLSTTRPEAASMARFAQRKQTSRR